MFFRKNKIFSKPVETKRSEEVTFQPQDQLKWVVCSNQVEGVGQGVSVEVFIQEAKVLKFDLFEAGDGHFHLFTGDPRMKSGRIAIPEKTLKEQTKRLTFELEFNLRNFRKLHHKEHIRSFNVDVPAVRAALPELAMAVLERGHH